MFKRRLASTNPRLATQEKQATSPARFTTPPRSAAHSPDLPIFAPGHRVAGRYRIENMLGRGVMGEVYEAYDLELSIRVALKLLRWRYDVGREREALWRLKREVLLARSVAHPHVCRVYDLGRHGDAPDVLWFLTMELLQGETLQEKLRRHHRLVPQEALPLVEQMAAGLSAAHRAGVVHRDFKSGNVMLVPHQQGERVVIVDFGLARPAGVSIGDDGTRTQPGVVLGTPATMSPEQVRGEEAGPAADIYALGVVLYQMITGVLPFTGKTASEAAVKRLVEDPIPPRAVADLDERWESVILRCLARDPRARFERAEEVAEVLAGRASLTAVGTPPAPVGYALPPETDAFVARETELMALEGKFSDGARLVSLLGAAGMGKTRLAMRFGWRCLDSWPGGVWFCDLTQERSPDGVASAMATTLGVTLGNGNPVEQLGHAIAGRKKCLIVLDNFDYVVEHAGETVGCWLERAREARFVVTSRERLNLREEECLAVEPLSLESGTELFLQRARRQRPGFELEGPELESVRELVQLTEGMPLAIELAAARVRVMTVAQVVKRMQERFRLLRNERGGRHASLSAAIDCSWDLLEPWERAAWMQCAVFEGGFTLEAAEAVIDIETPGEAHLIVDIVQSLVDENLLGASLPMAGTRQSVPEVRFGMYVSLHEYARMKHHKESAIACEGNRARVVSEERHGRWFASYGTDEALEALHRHGGMQRLWQIQREFENLVAACRRAFARGDGSVAVSAYRAAWEVFTLRGPYGAAVELGKQGLGMLLQREDRRHLLRTVGLAEWRCGLMDDARAHLEEALTIDRQAGNRRFEGTILNNLGSLHLDQGRLVEAQTHFEAALAIHRESGNRHGEGNALFSLGALDYEQGRIEEAHTRFEAALAIHHEIGSRSSEGNALASLGTLLSQQGKFEEARTHYQAALAIHREVGDRRSSGVVLGNLGIVNLKQGRFEEARMHIEQALAIHREMGNRRSEGAVMSYLGALHLELSQIEEARTYLEAALAIHRETGNRYFEGDVTGNLGILHFEQGRIEEARIHIEQALAIHHEMGNRRSEGIFLGYLGMVQEKEARLDEAREVLARGEALLREVGDQLELGKLLCIRADCERRIGDFAAARIALKEAEALAIGVGAGPDSELRHRVANVSRFLPSETED